MAFPRARIFLYCITIIELARCLSRSSAEDTVVSYRGHKVYRVFGHSKNDFAELARFSSNLPDDLDIWHTSHISPYWADVSVSQKIRTLFQSFLNRFKLNTTLLVDDLNRLINNNTIINSNNIENINETKAGAKKIHKKREIDQYQEYKFSLEKYNSLNEIVNWINDMSMGHPLIVALENIGQSFEKRQIHGLKIGKVQPNNQSKPSVWIDAGIHSREWISVATALYIIAEFIKRYNENDSKIVNLLNRMDFHIVPVLNPDGYVYSRQVNRLWRKTRSINEYSLNGKGTVCIGVDANRNFDHFWNSIREIGDEHACSDGYPGQRPFSESEAFAVAKNLQRLRPHLKAYITLHSYGQMWLAPWGYDTLKPKSYQRQRDVALLAIDALQSVHGTPYSFGTVSDLLYPASGTSVDYAHSLNITYSYAVELRPGETDDLQNGFRGFLHPESQIIPTGQETFAAVLTMTEEILNELDGIE